MIYPMFALVVLTYLVMFTLAFSRLRSVARNELPAKYYRLMQGYAAPDYVLKPTRHFSNLFETPVLFYVVCILYLVTGIQPVAAMALAWVYVGLRVVHAAIHLTYNHPIHRFLVFSVSILCLLALWIMLVVQI